MILTAMADVAISDRQVRVHKLTEAASVYLQLPFMVYLAAHRALPAWARLGSALLAVGILVVDGGLLKTWKAKASGQLGPFGN